MAVNTTDGAAITWDELFGDFAPALISYARSKGIRSAEDLVQDVLVTAVEKLGLFEGDRSGLRSWLFSITYRRIADEHRRFYRRPELLVGEHSPIADSGDLVDEVVAREDSAEEAIAALEVLRDRERAVLEMRIIEELTPGEVAEKLGITAGNVRVIQARALVKIRKHLKSTRNGATGSSIAYGMMPVLFLRYLGTGLPSDDVIEPWIDEVKTAVATEMVVGPDGHGLALAAEGAGAAAGVAVAAAPAASAGFAVATTVKLGLVVSLAAAPAMVAGEVAPSDGPVVTATSGYAAPVATDGLSVAAADGPPLPSGSSNHADPGVVAPGGVEVATPAPGGTSTEEEDAAVVVAEPEQAPEDSGSSQSDHSPSTSVEVSSDTGDASAVSADEDGSLLDAADGLVGDIVDPVSEDVVQPLVADTVETVNETLDTVQDEVVEPLVNGAVEPIVEDTVSNVDETVSELEDEVVDPLGAEAPDAVDGLLEDLLGGSGLLGS